MPVNDVLIEATHAQQRRYFVLYQSITITFPDSTLKTFVFMTELPLHTHQSPFFSLWTNQLLHPTCLCVMNSRPQSLTRTLNACAEMCLCTIIPLMTAVTASFTNPREERVQWATEKRLWSKEFPIQKIQFQAQQVGLNLTCKMFSVSHFSHINPQNMKQFCVVFTSLNGIHFHP